MPEGRGTTLCRCANPPPARPRCWRPIGPMRRDPPGRVRLRVRVGRHRVPSAKELRRQFSRPPLGERGRASWKGQSKGWSHRPPRPAAPSPGWPHHRKRKFRNKAVNLFKTRDSSSGRGCVAPVGPSKPQKVKMQEQSRQLIETRDSQWCIAPLGRGQDGHTTEGENAGTKPSTY